MNSFKILSVVLFFAAVFAALASAYPSPMLINFEGNPNLAQGLPLIRDALIFNRNGESVATMPGNLVGGPLIGSLNAVLGRRRRQADNPGILNGDGPILGLLNIFRNLLPGADDRNGRDGDDDGPRPLQLVLRLLMRKIHAISGLILNRGDSDAPGPILGLLQNPLGPDGDSPGPIRAIIQNHLSPDGDS